jgi:thiamine biosynthesis lipoprotein
MLPFVKYSKPGVTATLDAVAKGYIVDEGIKILLEMDLTNAFVEAGGDLMAVGHRYDGKPWKIGIRNPRSDDLKKMTTIEMSDRAIATSGDYMQYFTDDKKIHHIIDPRTGFSPVLTASSSVIAPTVAWADGLATAAMVLDPEQSIALIETLADCEGYLIDKDLNRYQTKGFFS